MCQFTTSWKDEAMQFPELSEIHESLKEMEADGLLTFIDNGITVTEKGKPFVRNICMAFDLRLIRKAPETKLFSMTI
jgi:oxygen-independent coproporphyrinogen-3 oxidase